MYSLDDFETVRGSSFARLEACVQTSSFPLVKKEAFASIRCDEAPGGFIGSDGLATSASDYIYASFVGVSPTLCFRFYFQECYRSS